MLFHGSHLCSHRRAVFVPLVFLLLITGCAQQPPKAPSQETDAAAQAAQDPATGPAAGNPHEAPGPKAAEADLPKQDLTDTILYEYLLAEIAGQRGNIALAAQAYADLAKRTRDPRIARRATEIAVYARMTGTAIDAARIWYQTEPGSQRAAQVLAGLLVSAGRLDEAQPILQEIISGGSDPGEAFMQISRTLSGVQDRSGALQLVQRLAETYQKLPQAHYAVAQAALAAQRTEVALAAARRAQELRPDWEPAVLLEAQILQQGSNGEALSRLGRYLEAYPNSRDVRLNYARTLVAAKRFGEARSEFQKLLANFPDNTEVVYAVALLSMQLGDWMMAETNLKRLLELNYRDRNSVMLYLGQVAEEKKDWPEALRWYAQIEGGGAQSGQARVRYAQVLAKQGKLAEARAYLQQANASTPEERVRFLLAEAQLLRDANRIQEAFDLIGQALKNSPDSPDLLYDYAMLAEKIDRIDLLESSLRKLIGIRPDYAHAYNALGYSLADRNQRLPEARELIEKALKLAPDDAFIIDSMGWVLYRMGERDAALKYLRRAFSDRPDPEIAAHLAEVLWAGGDRAEAEKLLRDAVQKNPDNDTLNNTVKRLKQ